jgi:hypothetical protein
MEIALAEPDTAALPTPIPTTLNVTALAKRFGVARTIRHRANTLSIATIPILSLLSLF